MQAIKNPRLIIPPEIWDKIMFFTRNSENIECSGLGLLELVNGDFYVRETFMVPQVNSSGETEMDPNGVGKAMFLCKDKPWPIKWHWHSHVDMNAFWSGTDDEMIRQNTKAGWFVHTVVNKRGDTKTCLAQQQPFPFYIEDIETILEPRAISEATKNAWQAEYTTNVTKKVFPVSNYSYTSGKSEFLPTSKPYGSSLDRHEEKKDDGFDKEKSAEILAKRLEGIKRRLEVVEVEMNGMQQEDVGYNELIDEWSQLDMAKENVEAALDILQEEVLQEFYGH